MAISVAGILINIIMFIIIVVTAIIGSIYVGDLNICENKQSPYCYTIQCPCDTPNGVVQPPCFGYTKRPASKSGQWYCSNAPLTTVDNAGNIISTT